MDENRKIVNKDEIDLTALFKTIWKKRWFVVKTAVVFGLIGVIIAFTSKVEYESSCKLLPESQDVGISNFRGLSGLAGLAGIDLGSTGANTLTPELYPEIIRSEPFLSDFLKTPIYFEKLDTTISCFIYMKEYDKPSVMDLIYNYTFGLPGKIKGLFEGNNSEQARIHTETELISYSKEDWGIIDSYKERFSINVEMKTGVITVKTLMPDRYAAAAATALLVNNLTSVVTEYKTSKSESSLQFIKDQFSIARKEYEKKQKVLASFANSNRNISNPLNKTEYERLQNDLNISFEVYKSLATQLEQAKIKVKEQTPVFTVLEPVKIPVSKSQPRRTMILIISLFLGVALSISFVTIQSLINK